MGRGRERGVGWITMGRQGVDGVQANEGCGIDLGGRYGVEWIWDQGI